MRSTRAANRPPANDTNTGRANKEASASTAADTAVPMQPVTVRAPATNNADKDSRSATERKGHQRGAAKSRRDRTAPTSKTRREAGGRNGETSLRRASARHTSAFTAAACWVNERAESTTTPSSRKEAAKRKVRGPTRRRSASGGGRPRKNPVDLGESVSWWPSAHPANAPAKTPSTFRATSTDHAPTHTV
ncbi:MAG: hypothetical protein COA68_17650 [Oceanobacter sp.]|nr:MAG: hypothetical protein COA68_17650 [Oceanobacter sp.]